jgi:hypothetical protein
MGPGPPVGLADELQRRRRAVGLFVGAARTGPGEQSARREEPKALAPSSARVNEYDLEGGVHHIDHAEAAAGGPGGRR